MVVPASGELEMGDLAKEKHYDDYNSGSPITGPISMYDLVNGGNTNGSGHSYDTTNQQSASRPDTTVPHAFSEWYSYDHDANTLYWSTFSPSDTSLFYTWGTTRMTHASKSAACASTNNSQNCVFIHWNGTIGNGTVIKEYCTETVAQDGVGGRWMKIGEYGGPTSASCGSEVTTEYVFQISTSGVVSNFGTCLTSYTSSDMGVFNETCPINGSVHTLNQTYYHDGSGTYPTAGDTCYSDSAGNNPLAAGYYVLGNSTSGAGNRNYIFIDNSNGIVATGYPQSC